ncbi:hypothetical protein ACU686_27940 [Yinghuangia aomiensis]
MGIAQAGHQETSGAVDDAHPVARQLTGITPHVGDTGAADEYLARERVAAAGVEDADVGEEGSRSLRVT